MTKKMSKELILASQSPRRRELLRQCGVNFTIRSADTAELEHADDPASLPRLNALIKAGAVADENPSSWVLGADTMILFENQTVGKPRNMADAARILQMFSGKAHQVITGVALICRELGEKRCWDSVSTVKFKELSPEVIGQYLSSVEVLDKAGAYGIQEHPEMIIESFSGELANIIGLPLEELKKQLQDINLL